jgi:hypothetical protein
MMEKAIVKGEIRKHAWEGSSVEVINNRPDGCDMDCVSYCFSDFSYRFENV